MLSRWETDRQFAARAATLKAEAVTPAHSAAEGEMDEESARRRRERVQHEVDPVDPYLHCAPEVDCIDVSELGKFRTDAVSTPGGYPPMRPVDAEQFRRGPATAGHAADSPGWSPPGRPVPVPSATLSPGMITRPPLSDGQSRPCAPEAC